MRLLKSLAFILILLALFSPHSLLFTPASSLSPDNDSGNELNRRIEEYQQKLQDLAGQKQTLTTTLNTLNTQINLTQAQISKTEKELTTLAEDIAALGIKIGQIDQSLGHLSEVMVTRIRETYKQSYLEPVYLLFSSQGFPDFINRIKYVRSAQTHDKNVFVAMEQIKLNYDTQKNVKEDKQAEVESLKLKLNKQKSALATRQLEKQKLLDLTKSDEARYQQLLAQAYAEKAAIERALVSGVKVGPVKRGDPIALVGNSGYPTCSTGKHLHFEIRKNGAWTDPGPYLSAKTVQDEQDNKGNINVGSGSWLWPIEDTVRLTQLYGQTPYSWRYGYSGGLHTGYDIVSTSSDVIRAPADGTLFKSSQMCGSNNINVVYIEHGDNLVSLYLHVQ